MCNCDPCLTIRRLERHISSQYNHAPGPYLIMQGAPYTGLVTYVVSPDKPQTEQQRRNREAMPITVIPMPYSH